MRKDIYILSVVLTAIQYRYWILSCSRCATERSYPSDYFMAWCHLTKYHIHAI